MINLVNNGPKNVNLLVYNNGPKSHNNSNIISTYNKSMLEPYKDIASINHSCCFVGEPSSQYNFEINDDSNINKNCIFYNSKRGNFVMNPCNTLQHPYVSLGKCISTGSATAVIGLKDISENKTYKNTNLVMRISSILELEDFMRGWRIDKMNYPKNIIDIYSYGEIFGLSNDNKSYYVMTKFYNTFTNDNLRDMTTKRRLNFVTQLLNLIEMVNSNGKYIRDLKLQNIGYDDDDNIILIDYEENTIIDPSEYYDELVYLSGTYTPYNIATLDGLNKYINEFDDLEIKSIKRNLLINSASVGLVHIIGSLFAPHIDVATGVFQSFMNKFAHNSAPRRKHNKIQEPYRLGEVDESSYLHFIENFLNNFFIGKPMIKQLLKKLLDPSYMALQNAINYFNNQTEMKNVDLTFSRKPKKTNNEEYDYYFENIQSEQHYHFKALLFTLDNICIKNNTTYEKKVKCTGNMLYDAIYNNPDQHNVLLSIGLKDIKSHEIFADLNLIMKTTFNSNPHRYHIEDFIEKWSIHKKTYPKNIINIYAYGKINILSGDSVLNYILTERYNTFTSSNASIIKYENRLKFIASLFHLINSLILKDKYIRDLRLENIGYDSDYNVVLTNYNEITILDFKYSSLLSHNHVDNNKVSFWVGSFAPYKFIQSQMQNLLEPFLLEPPDGDNVDDNISELNKTILHNSMCVGLAQIIGNLFLSEFDYTQKKALFDEFINMFTIKNLSTFPTTDEQYNGWITTNLRNIFSHDSKIIKLLQRLLLNSNMAYTFALKYFNDNFNPQNQSLQQSQMQIQTRTQSHTTAVVTTDPTIPSNLKIARGGDFKNKELKYKKKSEVLLGLLTNLK